MYLHSINHVQDRIKELQYVVITCVEFSTVLGSLQLNSILVIMECVLYRYICIVTQIIMNILSFKLVIALKENFQTHYALSGFFISNILFSSYEAMENIRKNNLVLFESLESMCDKLKNSYIHSI